MDLDIWDSFPSAGVLRLPTSGAGGREENVVDLFKRKLLGSELIHAFD